MNAWDLVPLILAAAIFVGSHLGISSSPLRAQAIARLGLNRYRGLYSLISLACLGWLIWAFENAPFLPVWPESATGRWLAVGLMPFSLILIAGALTPGNPTLLAYRPGRFVPAGIFAVTRHPLMWGIALASLAHIAALGDLASIILFGALGVLALAGTVLQDARKRREDPALAASLREATSNPPFAALLAGRTRLGLKPLLAPVLVGLVLYGLMLGGHGHLFGVSPLP